MKTHALIFANLLSAALAAPAIVWKNARQSERALHSADSLKSTDLLVDAFDSKVTSESSLASVVFLIGRSNDGSESLTSMAAGGSLPEVSTRYNDAETIYHHVSGLESVHSITRDANSVAKNGGHRVMSVSLNEFNNRIEGTSGVVKVEVGPNGLLAKSHRISNKRAREMALSDILVVKVDPAETDASDIDSAIVKAIESDEVQTVVLAGIRGVQETKYERNLLARRRMDMMEQEGQRMLNSQRRRLEQQDQGDGADADGDDNDMSGVYYVNMTPNIFAGILFFLLFIVVIWTGINCMGAIQSQDVYVTKMPSIGREA